MDDLFEVGLTCRGTVKVLVEGIARLHSPLGLDLGARSQQETALSIAADIVSGRRGGSGAGLRPCGRSSARNARTPAPR